ncbi:hypothetical protein L828_1103 [Mycobacteroides abscessus MAB_030201_1061]|nr:hypothetical protein L828_1103 [Mycobacteroides abscessus MAB_030201_1061]
MLMMLWRVAAPPFFQGQTLPRRSADLVLAPAAATTHFGLPDAVEAQQTVIAGDLSNLPEGEVAVNPQTGEEFTKD